MRCLRLSCTHRQCWQWTSVTAPRSSAECYVDIRHLLSPGPGDYTASLAFISLSTMKMSQNYEQKFRFLPRDAMHKRGICRHPLSVRASVTFVSCTKTNTDIFKIFLPSPQWVVNPPHYSKMPVEGVMSSKEIYQCSKILCSTLRVCKLWLPHDLDLWPLDLHITTRVTHTVDLETVSRDCEGQTTRWWRHGRKYWTTECCGSAMWLQRNKEDMSVRRLIVLGRSTLWLCWTWEVITLL